MQRARGFHGLRDELVFKNTGGGSYCGRRVGVDVDVEEVLVFVLVEKLFPQGRESEIEVVGEKESDFGFRVGVSAQARVD